MKKDTGKEKFFEDFGKRFNEVVLKIQMANIDAQMPMGNEILEKLNLSLPVGATVLWGLLVYCESGKLYFYVHPSETMMSAMVRVAKQGECPKEQCCCFSELEGFRFLEKKKHWYDFLIGAKYQHIAEFVSEGKTIQFIVNKM